MGTEASTDASASTDGNTGGQTSTATDEFKPITSQADLDALISSRLDRERGKYADYKDLKAKASRLDEIEAANKSELEKANDRVAAAETEVAALPAKQAETLRTALVSLGVVAKEDEVLLTASTPDDLLAQVQRLSERSSTAKKQGNRVPKEGNPSQSGTDEMREFTRNLFGKGD